MSNTSNTSNTSTLRITTRLNSATTALKQEFVQAYCQPDENGLPPSQDDIESTEQTAAFIEQLIQKHLAPTLQAMEVAAAAAAVPAKIPNATPTGKKKSAWSVFLNGPAKEIPGWDTAPNKATFASKHYKLLSKADKQQLVANYYAEHGGVPMSVATSATNSSTTKKPRISGLDAYKKDWYARRKQTNPDAKGIDSQCTEDWKALKQSEKDEWKEIRRQQVTNVA